MIQSSTQALRRGPGPVKKTIACMGLGFLSIVGAGAALAQITVEAEKSMSLSSGYAVDSNDGTVIKIASGSTGTASHNFSGASGTYNMQVYVMLENDGQPTLEVYKGSSLLKKYTYPLGTNGNIASFSIDKVVLSNGENVKLVGRTNAGALARVDKVVYSPVSTSTSTSTTTTSTTTSGSITYQAENMSRSRYVVDGPNIKIASGYSTGTATQSFNGTSGSYDLQVYVELEPDGQSTLEVSKGSTLLKTYTYPLGTTLTSFTIPGVALSAGETIKLVGRINAGALARVDKIILNPVSTSTATASPTTSTTTTTTPTTTTSTPSTTTTAYPTQGNTGGLPVIPGASGFGINTKAGRGGTVYRVTNVNASGTGSLKACIDATVPRVCVFETSGTIRLTSDMIINNPYITIAGQTAPSPGITIRGAGLVISTNDVLVQHLRVRVGDVSDNPDTDRDAVAVVADRRNVYNVVVDHVSVSWGTDELFSTWAGNSYKIYDVTVRNSVFSEALNYSIHSKGEHSAAFLVGVGTTRFTGVNNVLGYSAWRNPLIRDDCTDVMMVNNFIYRTRGARTDQINFGDRGPGNLAMRASVVGNNFVLAPGLSATNTISINSNAPSSVTLYQKNNLGPRYSSTNAWAVVDLGGRSQSSVEAGSPPIWAPGVVAMDAADVEAYTLQYAGARPADRDAVDKRVIANLRARQGDIINSQNDVGGWPNLAVNVRPLTLPANPNVTNSNGYTNLELWLQGMARAVEGL